MQINFARGLLAGAFLCAASLGLTTPYLDACHSPLRLPEFRPSLATSL